MSDSEDDEPKPRLERLDMMTRERCECAHLENHLPHLLSLDLYKVKDKDVPRGWIIANPIHSMHLSSIVDNDLSGPSNKKFNPVIFGEEQLRTMAMSTEGILEWWHPPVGLFQSIESTNAGSSNTTSSTASTSSKKLASVKEERKGSLSSTSSITAAATVAVKSADDESLNNTKTLQPATETSASDWARSSNDAIIKSEDEPDKESSQMPPPADVAAEKKASANTTSAPTSGTNPSFDASQILPNTTKSSTLEPNTIPSSSVDPVMSSADAPKDGPDLDLTEERFNELRQEEDRIKCLRQALLAKREKKKNTKKRKRDKVSAKLDLSAWKPLATPKTLTDSELKEWNQLAMASRIQVEKWLEQYRLNRNIYHQECETKSKGPESEGTYSILPFRDFFSQQNVAAPLQRCCEICTDVRKQNTAWLVSGNQKSEKLLAGDELMHCLDCSFVGCAPKSSVPESRGHILQHMLLSGHNFAVSCGEESRLFCFQCGQFVEHPLFEQEKHRIDCEVKLPYMAWNSHKVLRSFDAYQFVKTLDCGIAWKGFVATYPSSVPADHVIATRMSLRRKALLDGSISESWLAEKHIASDFASAQFMIEKPERCKLITPIGIGDLGRTSFLSASLQCLIHCIPLQEYFLRDTGHHHCSCKVYRESHARKIKRKQEKELQRKLEQNPGVATTTSSPFLLRHCLACEMDRLLLSYHSISRGYDAHKAIESANKDSNNLNIDVGSAKISSALAIKASVDATPILSATWTLGGMAKLSALEQRDAHSFLQRFLRLLGQDTMIYRQMIHARINSKVDNSALCPPCAETSVVKQLFEGSFRSVFICKTCRNKKPVSEPFTSVEIMLSNEITKNAAENAGKPYSQQVPLRVERCLERLVFPEHLTDLVHCPTCSQSTRTMKQRTFSRLPKVLCIYINRFDFLKNHKIDDHVSYPINGLNMGPLLSHWKEVPSATQTDQDRLFPGAVPDISYDLFGTVRHIGRLQGGHCVSDVKIAGTWHRCHNDRIAKIGRNPQRLPTEGACILFYVRK